MKHTYTRKLLNNYFYDLSNCIDADQKFPHMQNVMIEINRDVSGKYDDWSITRWREEAIMCHT